MTPNAPSDGNLQAAIAAAWTVEVGGIVNQLYEPNGERHFGGAVEHESLYRTLQNASALLPPSRTAHIEPPQADCPVPSGVIRLRQNGTVVLEHLATRVGEPHAVYHGSTWTEAVAAMAEARREH